MWLVALTLPLMRSPNRPKSLPPLGTMIRLRRVSASQNGRRSKLVRGNLQHRTTNIEHRTLKQKVRPHPGKVLAHCHKRRSRQSPINTQPFRDTILKLDSDQGRAATLPYHDATEN